MVAQGGEGVLSDGGFMLEDVGFEGFLEGAGRRIGGFWRS